MPTVPIFVPLPGSVHRGRCGRLGQAVALQDVQPEAAVEVAEPLAQRGAARDRVARIAAERRAQALEHEDVGDLVLHLQPQARPARRVQGARVDDRGLRGALEDRALAARGGLLLGRVVDLLEHARHGEDERRPEGREVLDQRAGVGGVAEDRAGRDAEHLDEPGEHVRQRHEQQRPRAGLPDDLVQVGHRVDGELVEVAVRQLDALGPAGRARRVDDRRDVGQDGQAAPAGDLLVGHGVRAGEDGLDRAVVEPQDLTQGRGVRADLLDRRCVPRGLDDEERHVRVGEDPQHLLGGGRLVQRNGDGADRPDGPVQQRPLVARVRHDADAVARLDTPCDQALRDGHDLRVELLRGQRDPGAARLRLVLDDHAVRGPGHALGEEVVEVVRGVDLETQGRSELVHAGSSDSGEGCDEDTGRTGRHRAGSIRSRRRRGRRSGACAPTRAGRLAWGTAPVGRGQGTSA